MSSRNVLLSTITFMVIALPSSSHSALAQEAVDKASEKERINAIKDASAKVSILSRISFDRKFADELELAPDQKTKVLIALQKYQDESRKLRQTTAGKKPDFSAYQDQVKKLVDTVEDILTDRQSEKLSELAKEAAKPRTKVPSLSHEELQEMQKLSSMMRELSRLAYDQKLSSELEITAEQKVEIREAQQDHQLAMTESMKARAGGAFDIRSHNEMMRELMMKTQEILTPEQSEKLARVVKLKTLKSKFGDEFAMINGLAEDFDLSEKQTLELREKIAEARQDYYEGIKKLKEDTMKEIIGELPREHREEVEEAVSEFLKEDPMKKRSPYALRVGG